MSHFPACSSDTSTTPAKPLETTGRGMGWLPSAAGHRLLVERAVPGGGPLYPRTP